MKRKRESHGGSKSVAPLRSSDYELVEGLGGARQLSRIAITEARRQIDKTLADRGNGSARDAFQPAESPQFGDDFVPLEEPDQDGADPYPGECDTVVSESEQDGSTVSGANSSAVRLPYPLDLPPQEMPPHERVRARGLRRKGPPKSPTPPDPPVFKVTRQPAGKKAKYFGVRRGRIPGIYYSWG